MAKGNPLDGEGPGKRIGDGAAIVVVEADDGGTGRWQTSENAALEGDIIFQSAVAIEVIWRDVEERRSVGCKRRRKVDLEGRQLKHIGKPVVEGWEIEYGAADVAAERDRPPP